MTSPSTRPKVVILNDTATRYHHGCARVMGNLVAGLSDAGCEVMARIPARTDIAKNPKALQAINAADLIVINGEGTLHDGAEHGARLLQVIDLPERGRTPVALVNALWQNNPPAWIHAAKAMALVASRDSASAATLAQAGVAARLMPDLSLAQPFVINSIPRHDLIVGDSVKLSARQHLAKAAQRLDATYLPTKTLSNPVWRLPVMRKLLWRVYNMTFNNPLPRFEMSADAGAYLSRLASARGHITGRFHGICLSMLVESPFLAVASTTSKVQILLQDAGLGQSRLITPADLAQVTEVPPYTHAELEAIRDYRQLAQDKALGLFQDIKALA